MSRRPRPEPVDRPQLAVTARRALLVGAYVVAGCAVLGGSSFAYLMLHHTRPKGF